MTEIPTPRTDAVALDQREGVTHPELCETYMAWTDYWALRELARQLERELAAQKGWIACSERTPDAQYDVLVSDGTFVGIGDCCKGHLWNSGQIELVTHWMPLPQPPLKGAGGNVASTERGK